MDFKTPRQPAQFKANFEKRQIEGYASIFGNVDSVGDVVMPGAFKRTIANQLPQRLIKVCLNHNPDALIGSPAVGGLSEDSTGLYTLSDISAIPEGDKVLQLVSEGHLTHMSFAYDVIRRDFIQPEDATKAPIRQLQEVKLYEYGPVTFPANEAASILGAKAIEEAMAQANAAVPQLHRLLEKRGFFKDSEIELYRHLSGVITEAIAASFQALSAADPEPIAATTPAGDPPPTAGDDPEGKAYENLSLRLMTFNSQRRLAGLRAAAQQG